MTNNIQQFQIFAKPVGPNCNLNCHYCYYLDKKKFYPNRGKTIMNDEMLEQYILQHIEAANAEVIVFSWHGGEPLLSGVDYFKKIVRLQQKHKPPDCQIINGIQTNGTLLNEEWCDFLAREKFTVGISLDGTEEMHNAYRKNFQNKKTHHKTMHGIGLLKKYKIFFEVLCVVHNQNVNHPLKTYRFLKETGTGHISFLPLIEKLNNGVSKASVPANKYGQFLCNIFDEWVTKDIGKIKIQIIEEAARTAFKQEHSLCIFRKTCGSVPVVEHNGDFYSCDHFVEPQYLIGNIKNNSIAEMLNDPKQKAFGNNKWELLPGYCLQCNVREMCNGGCPKNRILKTPGGEPGLNYLCEGYKQFFNHMMPFINSVRNTWINQ